jgi:hypothetical protein
MRKSPLPRVPPKFNKSKLKIINAGIGANFETN